MVIMKTIESAGQVVVELGQKFPKGKTRGKFPAERHWITIDESKKMAGLIPGSRQTSQQEYEARAEGKRFRMDVLENPDFYKNEQP